MDRHQHLTDLLGVCLSPGCLERSAAASTRRTQEFVNPDPVTQAYMEVVESRAHTALPRLYKVDPYGYLPDTAPPRVHPEDYLFDAQ